MGEDQEEEMNGRRRKEEEGRWWRTRIVFVVFTTNTRTPEEEEDDGDGSGMLMIMARQNGDDVDGECGGTSERRDDGKGEDNGGGDARGDRRGYDDRRWRWKQQRQRGWRLQQQRGGTTPSTTTREGEAGPMSRVDDGDDDSGPREYDDERGDDEIPTDSKTVTVVFRRSERKMRRELIVLAHCTRHRLPNLARLIGVVLPDSMDKDGDEADDGHASRDLGEEKGGGK